MVEQKALARLVRAGGELPGAVGLADGVPGPDRAGLYCLAVAQHAAHLAPLAFHPGPAAVGNACGLRGAGVDVQVVVAVDLAQPGVLRVPRVVHRHGPLGNGVQRIGGQVGGVFFEGRVPKRQRIKIGVNALTQVLGRLAPFGFSLGGQAKGLQRVRVNGELHRVVLLAPAFVLGKVQIFPVPVAHVVHGLRHVVLEHAVVLLVRFPLLGVGLAAQVFVAIFAAPAHQKANAGLGLKVHYKVGVAGEFAPAFGGGEGREFEATCQLDQHFLERPAFAQGLDHRNAHRVHRAIKLRDRAVQHAHHVVAF